jgi:hypothetical protein
MMPWETPGLGVIDGLELGLALVFEDHGLFISTYFTPLPLLHLLLSRRKSPQWQTQRAARNAPAHPPAHPHAHHHRRGNGNDPEKLPLYRKPTEKLRGGVSKRRSRKRNGKHSKPQRHVESMMSSDSTTTWYPSAVAIGA